MATGVQVKKIYYCLLYQLVYDLFLETHLTFMIFFTFFFYYKLMNYFELKLKNILERVLVNACLFVIDNWRICQFSPCSEHSTYESGGLSVLNKTKISRTLVSLHKQQKILLGTVIFFIKKRVNLFAVFFFDAIELSPFAHF